LTLFLVAGVDVSNMAGGISKQQIRHRAIIEAVVSEGSVRIESLAERFDISVMTVHRDLDELEARGLLRKARGQATALSTSIVESSDVYRLAQQATEKAAIARTALELVEPGQSLMMDDSTTVLQMAQLLEEKLPLTVVTNSLRLMNQLAGGRGISLVALGGTYFNGLSAFMGRTTTESISRLRADTFLMSTASVVDGMCFHQSEETVAVKSAMFEAAEKRVLLVDSTKFERRAMHAVVALEQFDHVVVDSGVPQRTLEELQSIAQNVIIAPQSSGE
jgi:DeoR/GlpR family transcriptional regulator of sugar metabolism